MQSKAKDITGTKEFGMFLAFLILFIFCSVFLNNFITGSNLQNLSRQIALLTILAVGEAFVVITAGIDLSVGSMIALTGVLTAIFFSQFHIPLILAIPMVMIISLLVGYYHGLLITRFKVPPFVATLGTLGIAKGLALVITEAQPKPVLSSFLNFLGNGKFLGLFIPVYIALIVIVVSILIMKYSLFGRYVYSIGSNYEASRLSGVKVRRVQITAYMISALLAGVTGILYAGYLREGSPRTGGAYELYAIAAVVIGGCSLMGGEGKIIGVVIGASIMQLIQNALGLSDISSFWQDAVVGAVVVGAVVLDSIRQKRITI
ncbi:ABC transporter permease [candidate division KSB1 bacterium]